MKKCSNCGKCCQFGSGFLAGNDKEKIALFLGVSAEELEKNFLEKVEMFGTTAWRPRFPKPFGRCIFYDEKMHCTIHRVKPSLCALSSCSEDATEAFYKKYFVKKTKVFPGGLPGRYHAHKIKQSQDEWKICEEVKNGGNERKNNWD